MITIDPTNVAVASAVGLFMPFVVDLVNNKLGQYSSRVRFIVAIVMSLLGAIVSTAIVIAEDPNSVPVEPVDYLLIGAYIFTVANLIYKLYWKKSDVRESTLPSLYRSSNNQ